MVFYFTATGNSLYVAKQLEPRPVSIAQAVHDSEKVYRAERIGIVCPVFGHEMPELVKEFLKASRFETEYFYILLTYGCLHGGASELAEKFVRTQGIQPAYINVILMVDNFLPAFDMDEERMTDKQVDVQLGRIKKDIAEKIHLISPVTEKDRAIHQAYLDFAAKTPPDALPYVSDYRRVHRMRNLPEGMSKGMFSSGGTEKHLGASGLHQLHGLHPCLPHGGHPSDHAGKESESQIPQ